METISLPEGHLPRQLLPCRKVACTATSPDCSRKVRGPQFYVTSLNKTLAQISTNTSRAQQNVSPDPAWPGVITLQCALRVAHRRRAMAHNLSGIGKTPSHPPEQEWFSAGGGFAPRGHLAKHLETFWLSCPTEQVG